MNTYNAANIHYYYIVYVLTTLDLKDTHQDVDRGKMTTVIQY